MTKLTVLGVAVTKRKKVMLVWGGGDGVDLLKSYEKPKKKIIEK